MDISRLKTYCEKRLGYPAIDVDLHEDAIKTLVEEAIEDLEDSNIRLGYDAKHLYIKRYVSAKTKISVARIKGMYPMKGVSIDYEALLAEGNEEMMKLFEDLDKENGKT